MKIFFLIIFQLPLAFSMEGISACGTYKIAGIAKTIDGTPYIVVNESTLSEQVISIPISEQPRLAPYLGHAIEIDVKIDQPFNGTKGQASELQNTKLRIPNPLSEKTDTGMKLLNKSPCRK